MVGEESVFEGCLVDVVCYCVDLDVCGGLMFQWVFGELVGGYCCWVGFCGYLVVYFDQGCGVQYVGDFVDGQQFLFGQCVVMIQWNDVFGLDQCGFVVGQYDQVCGDVGVGGGGLGCDQLFGLQCGEYCCVILKFMWGGQLVWFYGCGCVGVGNVFD